MDIHMDKSATVYCNSFNFVITELKSNVVLWDDLLSKATKLSSNFKGTLLAASAFMDSVQKIADAATRSKGATREIGSALTRLCMRHKNLETHVKNFSSRLSENIVATLQDRLEEWKKSTMQLDKDHAKVTKRAKADIKRSAGDTLRISKKSKKGRGDLRVQLEHSEQELRAKYTALEEAERTSLRKALIEERSRYCLFISCLKPLIDEEIAMLSEIEHLEEILQLLCSQASDPYSLPVSSEQAISDLACADGTSVVGDIKNLMPTQAKNVSPNSSHRRFPESPSLSSSGGISSRQSISSCSINSTSGVPSNPRSNKLGSTDSIDEVDSTEDESENEDNSYCDLLTTEKPGLPDRIISPSQKQTESVEALDILPPGRQSSISSHDSGFVSQDTNNLTRNQWARATLPPRPVGSNASNCMPIETGPILVSPNRASNQLEPLPALQGDHLSSDAQEELNRAIEELEASTAALSGFCGEQKTNSEIGSKISLHSGGTSGYGTAESNSDMFLNTRPNSLAINDAESISSASSANSAMPPPAPPLQTYSQIGSSDTIHRVSSYTGNGTNQKPAAKPPPPLRRNSVISGAANDTFSKGEYLATPCVRDQQQQQHNRSTAPPQSFPPPPPVQNQAYQPQIHHCPSSPGALERNRSAGVAHESQNVNLPKQQFAGSMNQPLLATKHQHSFPSTTTYHQTNSSGVSTKPYASVTPIYMAPHQQTSGPSTAPVVDMNETVYWNIGGTEEDRGCLGNRKSSRQSTPPKTDVAGHDSSVRGHSVYMTSTQENNSSTSHRASVDCSQGNTMAEGKTSALRKSFAGSTSFSLSKSAKGHTAGKTQKHKPPPVSPKPRFGKPSAQTAPALNVSSTFLTPLAVSPSSPNAPKSPISPIPPSLLAEIRKGRAMLKPCPNGVSDRSAPMIVFRR